MTTIEITIGNRTGCLYGSHVATGEGGPGVETRKVAKGVYLVGGKPVVQAEYDRTRREITVALLDSNEVERRYRFYPATGEISPV